MKESEPTGLFLAYRVITGFAIGWFAGWASDHVFQGELGTVLMLGGLILIMLCLGEWWLVTRRTP